MNFIKEFRDNKIIKELIDKIQNISKDLHTINIMEICGGHTHSIMRYGLHQLLPSNINFVHGPGCPVCIMPQERIDQIIYLSDLKDTIIVTFGDMLRVPGTNSSLIKERAKGKDIKMIYSPLEVINIAKENKEKNIIFFAIGFETTTPMTASLLDRVIKENINNVYFFINHVMVPPAIEAIFNDKDVNINALIGPGHVSTITGSKIYEPIANTYNIPIIISGFEPIDLLQSVYMIIQQIKKGISEVWIQYKRVVSIEPNIRAQELINKYLEIREQFEWRGIGAIPYSGLKLKSEFSKFDVESIYKDILPKKEIKQNNLCICGQILKGKAKPYQCKAFKNLCTPSNPIGACMVSNEGACYAYYKYY